MEDTVGVKDKKVLLGISRIMSKTGWGRDTVNDIMDSGELHVVKVGKRQYVHEEVLDKWLKGEYRKVD